MNDQIDIHHSRNKGLADRLLFWFTIIFVVATAALMKWDGYWPLVFVQSLSAAAIIGGVADWYGVVSIYGRPLGIPYNTEIIVRKRRELLSAIRSFVSDDILSTENITNKLRQYPLVQRLLGLLNHNRNQDGPFVWLNNFISAIVFNVVKNADKGELAERIHMMLKGVVTRTSPSEEIIRVARWTIANNYDEKIFDALMPGMIGIVENDGFQSIMSEFTERFHSKYTGNSVLRKKWGDFRNELDKGVSSVVVSFLDELSQNQKHPIRKDIKNWLEASLINLERDKAMQASIDSWIAMLLENPEVTVAIEEALQTLKNTTFSEANCNATISLLLGKLVDRLQENKEALNTVNVWIIGKLVDVIESNHARIGELVDASLNEMDDLELVTFVRERTENDLQLIRVNGMFFGVFIGAIVTSVRFIVA